MKRKVLLLIEVILIIVVGNLVYQDAKDYYCDDVKEWIVEESPDGKYQIIVYCKITKLPFAKQQLEICVSNPFLMTTI